MRQSLQNFNKIKVSVIIVSYNTEKLTLQCIKSVIDSVINLYYEIIVIDNNSNDKTVYEISKVKDHKPKVKIEIIKNDKNLGFSKAVNQGIKNAKGEYILLLNSDTVVPNGAINKLLNFAQEKKDAGVIGARLLNEDKNVQASCFFFPTIKRAFLQYFCGKKNYLEKYAPITESFEVVESVVGAVFMITPVALKKVGIFDERYFMYFEDLDYCRRVRNAGLKVYYYAGASVIHIHGASGKKLVSNENQWRRLIPSSKIYHGLYYHYLLNGVLWLGQKWQGLFANKT